MASANLAHALAAHKEVMAGINGNGFNKFNADTVITLSYKQLIQLMEDNAKATEDRIEAKNEAKFKEIATEMASLRAQIVKGHLAQEKSQQYNNRDTFKICGVKAPKLGPKEHEDTDSAVVKFLEKASVPLPKTELSMTHRIPSRDSTRCDALLVKLRSRIVRNTVMRKKKDMKDDAALKEAYPGAFIVEHLTPLRAKVAYMLRQDENIGRCWTIDGRIKVLKKGFAPTDKPITVDNLSQLTRIPGWTDEDVAKLVLEA